MDQFNKSTNENHLYMKFLRYKVVPNSEILWWIVQFNKSTTKTHTYINFFLSCLKMIFSIQQVNGKITQPHIQKFWLERPIQQVNGQKTPICEIFELMKYIFSQFNKSTAKWHNPTFRNFSQDGPIQQVNARKTPIYEIFELVK